MVPPTDDENKLLIRCPGCGQRFKVQQDFRNRMVECGVCQHRFHIREDVIVRLKKFYPGEKRHHGLSRFQRIQYWQSIDEPLMASSLYEHFEPTGYFKPASPQQVIAGLLGVLAMLAIGMLLLFGSGLGGPLDGMEFSRKLVIAGFTAALGWFLLVYANPNTRRRAALIGGCLSAVLVSLPFFINGNPKAFGNLERTEVLPTAFDAAKQQTDTEDAALKAMNEKMDLRPLEREIQRFISEESTSTAYGLILIDLQESNRIAVRDYMFRVSSPEASSHIYPRSEGKYLFVLSGLEMKIERLASLASPLGKVRLISPEIHVVEIVVDNTVFIESPLEKLINREDPDFYEHNLRELKSIDLQRIQRAVTRLAEAEPRMFRADITSRFRELMFEPGINFHGTIARALSSWDIDPVGAAQIATQTAVRMRQRGATPPAELIALAIERPSEELIPVIISLWRENTLMWESYCIKIGPPIEQAMLKEFEAGEGSISQSAARILSRVGGEESGKRLYAALENADRELAVIIRQALEIIASRIGPEIEE
jgi:hypothetical protein